MEEDYELLCAEIYVALTPKLGGGGITPDQMKRLRDIAGRFFNSEQCRICTSDEERLNWSGF